MKKEKSGFIPGEFVIDYFISKDEKEKIPYVPFRPNCELAPALTNLDQIRKAIDRWITEFDKGE